MKIRIGLHRIADATGTHEPGEVIDNPSQALIDLVEAKTKDENGAEYATEVKVVPPATPADPPKVNP